MEISVKAILKLVKLTADGKINWYLVPKEKESYLCRVGEGFVVYVRRGRIVVRDGEEEIICDSVQVFYCGHRGSDCR